MGLIVGLALILRLVCAFMVTQHVENRNGEPFLIPGDANGYWELATTLVEGRPYQVHQPPRQVLRMPGFPLLLAVPMSIVGENYLATRLMLGVIGAVACGMVYWLGVRLDCPNEALIAGILAAVSPAFVGFSVLILTETVFAVGLLGSLITYTYFDFSKSGNSRNYSIAFVLGIVIAFACYLKPSWILAMPIFAVAIIWNLKNHLFLGFGLASLIVLGVAISLAPWTYRNFEVTSHFVPTTLWMGPSLYDGLNPVANGKSNMQFFDNDALMNSKSEYEVDQHYRKESWKFVIENPGKVIQLAFVKLGLYFKPWPDAAELNSSIVRLGLAVFTIPVFFLAVLGLWTVRNEWNTIFLLLGPLVYFAGIHAVFVSSLRYRIPAEYPLLILAAIGVRHLMVKSPQIEGGADV